jgi:hypothetical protein
MSIIINNFSDIDTLNSIYDSSLCIIFSTRENIDISSSKDDIIIMDLYDELIEIKKEIWKETNKACKLLPYNPYKLSNSIWNIFFIEYINEYKSSDNDILLIMNGDISGVFGIYDKKNIIIKNCINRLFFSNKLKTFVLYDVFETEIENDKYVVGQLMSHLNVNYPYISFINIDNNKYKCPISWRKFSNNTYGISRNLEKGIVKPWKIEMVNSYLPIHILSELKILYIWLLLIFKYRNRKKVNKKSEYKKITYQFSDIEYGKLKKYAMDENIIEYLIMGYLKFMGIECRTNEILFEVTIDDNMKDIYPLISSIEDYNIYKKSKLINRWVKKWNICNKIDKILLNVYIDKEISNSELSKRDDILIQIDIGIDKKGRLINIIYIENSENMLRWKNTIDNFLNMWVK